MNAIVSGQFLETNAIQKKLSKKALKTGNLAMNGYKTILGTKLGTVLRTCNAFATHIRAALEDQKRFNKRVEDLLDDFSQSFDLIDPFVGFLIIFAVYLYESNVNNDREMNISVNTAFYQWLFSYNKAQLTLHTKLIEEVIRILDNYDFVTGLSVLNERLNQLQSYATHNKSLSPGGMIYCPYLNKGGNCKFNPFFGKDNHCQYAHRCGICHRFGHGAVNCPLTKHINIFPMKKDKKQKKSKDKEEKK